MKLPYQKKPYNTVPISSGTMVLGAGTTDITCTCQQSPSAPPPLLHTTLCFTPSFPPSFNNSHYPRLSSSSPTSPPFPPHPLLPSPYVLPLLHLSPPISPSMCPPPPQVIIKSTPLSMATNQHTSHQGSLGWNGTNLILMIDMCPS